MGTAATDSRDGGGAVATLEPVRIGADGHSDPFATEARVTAEGAGPVGDTEDPELAVYPDPTSGIKIRHGSDEGRGARIVRRQGRRKRFSMGGEYGKRFDDTDENRCYTFRIRSKYDERGNLAEARYGKIYGDFKFEGHLDRGIISVRFLYYLNPTPLDRNLEWDMKGNLCTNPNLANLPQP